MGLIRFLLHGLALLALVAAILAGAIDSIQSVSASRPVLTSLGNAWLNLSPETLTVAEMSADSYAGMDLWRPVVAPILAQPAFAVFLALAFLSWIAGYRREASVRSTLRIRAPGMWLDRIRAGGTKLFRKPFGGSV